MTKLVAVLLLDVVLGAGCFLGAFHRPGPARTAATVATALLAVGWLVLAGVLYSIAESAENAGTFGATAIGLVGSIILLAGLGMAALAVVIERGGDGGRTFMAARARRRRDRRSALAVRVAGGECGDGSRVRSRHRSGGARRDGRRRAAGGRLGRRCPVGGAPWAVVPVANGCHGRGASGRPSSFRPSPRWSLAQDVPRGLADAPTTTSTVESAQGTGSSSTPAPAAPGSTTATTSLIVTGPARFVFGPLTFVVPPAW